MNYYIHYSSAETKKTTCSLYTIFCKTNTFLYIFCNLLLYRPDKLCKAARKRAAGSLPMSAGKAAMARAISAFL